MKNTIYLFIFLSIITSKVVSQTTDRLPCIDKKFSIVVHIVKDSLGKYGFTKTQIQKDVDSLNKNFAPICVSFEVCEYRYIDNFLYLEVDTAHQWKEMQVLYNAKDRINIYYVKTLLAPSGAGFAGLGKITDMTKYGIVLTAPGESVLSHEMGHYFGLEHTFEVSHGLELVNGSNCATAGDQICDTPADPNGLVDASCHYTSKDVNGQLVKDANKQFYSPLVNNIMSYYPSICLCKPGFTHDQYKKMAKTYLSKPGMW
jgi:hypothetical protein